MRQRNDEAFRLVTDALSQGRVVLVFPEGISHDEPAIAPLRTGAARMAFAARSAGAQGVQLLSVGLVFEAKERPRSRVLVRIGEPLSLDDWLDGAAEEDAAKLTRELTLRLRAVTLNFPTEARARRAVGVARALAAIAEEPASLGTAPSLATEAHIAARVEAATAALESSAESSTALADAFLFRLDALEQRLAARGVTLQDVKISPRVRHGARFVLREGSLAIAALPVAFLGWATHWVPIRLARTLALRSMRGDPSRDQPAMRTIVAGLAVVLLWYTAQAALVARWVGGWAAVAWIVAIMFAAQVQLLLSERLVRARRRARAFLTLRHDPSFRAEVLREVGELLDQALALERALLRTAEQEPR